MKTNGFNLHSQFSLVVTLVISVLQRRRRIFLIAMRLKSFKMISVFVALSCFYVSCVNGFIVSSSTTKPLDDDLDLLPATESTIRDLNQTFTNLSFKLIQDITDKLNQSKSGLENSDDKINETELYENGQAAKENNERSFIFINQKFKSPWFDTQRSLTRKSMFSSGENSDHFDDIASKFSIGFESVENIVNHFRATAKPVVQNNIKSVSNKSPHKNPSKNLNKAPIASYKQNKAFYNPVLVVPTHTEENREYVELLKRPMVRPVPIPINGRTNIRYPDAESYRPYDKRIIDRHFFNDDDDSVVPRLAVQNQQHVQTKFNNYGAPSLPKRYQSTVVSSSRIDNTRNMFDFKFNFDTTNKISESYEEDEKLDQYLKNTLRGETSFGRVDENSYDCYNRSCKRLSNKHNMQRLNNGVLLGLNCVCNDGSTKDRSSRNNSENSKEVLVPYSNSTEINDYDERVKETENFNKVSDQSDVKIIHNNVNKTGCTYSGWYQPKCNNKNK